MSLPADGGTGDRYLFHRELETGTSPRVPQVCWRVLKNRLKKEGNETVINCNALKMLAPDGKMRFTDVADRTPTF